MLSLKARSCSVPFKINASIAVTTPTPSATATTINADSRLRVRIGRDHIAEGQVGLRGCL